MSKHCWCYYFVQNDAGESERAPNAFKVVFEGAGPVAHEVWSQFPLRGTDAFHFRFKVGSEAASAWLDVLDAHDTVPLVGNKIVAKLLRLSAWEEEEGGEGCMRCMCAWGDCRWEEHVECAASLTCASRRVSVLGTRGGVGGARGGAGVATGGGGAPSAVRVTGAETAPKAGGSTPKVAAPESKAPTPAAAAAAAPKAASKVAEEDHDIFGMGAGAAGGGGARGGSARAGAAAGGAGGTPVPVVASPGWDEDNSWQIPPEGTVMTGGGIVSALPKVEATDEDIRGMDRSSLDEDLASKEDVPLDVRLKMQWRRNRDREAAAAKVAEIKAREDAKKAFDEKRFESKQKMQGKLDAWALTAGGDVRPIRVLLSSMHNVLWEGHSWNAVAISDLVAAPKVKITYRKACLVVHPDRQPASASADRKYSADYIFNALNKSFKHFEEHELGVSPV
jgi:hypothetical protein